MRFLTLLALALVMATIVVAATHAQSMNVEGVVNQALEIVVQIMRTIFDVIVDFIGDILDEFVRAGKSLFSGGKA